MTPSNFQAKALEHIQMLSHPLYPYKTSLNAYTKSLDIRAIIFDIYGTLFISNAGDISLASSAEGMTSDIQKSLQTLNIHIGTTQARYLSTLYHTLIHSIHKKKRSEGIEHPEVDIIAVWREILHASGIQMTNWRSAAAMLALQFEMRINPVWPMPGLRQLLAYLKQHSFPWGIISNAQFYTKLLFPALVDATIEKLGSVFNCWSYAEGCVKPEKQLFEKAVLFFEKEYGIKNTEILYVGNDMLNDIWGAKQCGIKTALFAGDQRSLRLRTDLPQCSNLHADIIITALEQLIPILPLSAQ